MKAGILAVAAAMAAGVSATGHAGRRHAHEAFHLARGIYAPPNETTCGCTTIYTTIYGEATLMPPPPAPKPTTTSAYIYVPTSSPAPVVPTPLATTCPTPGIYTIPATTITLTESTTVCAATSTHVPEGTHTYGGVTTVVETETTVVCPYATVSTHEGQVTSTILTTTYVCPSAGTYTLVPPETTTVSVSTVIVYPTPAEYAPGTYTQPEIVTTITETNYVVFCPYTSPAPAPEPKTTYVAPPPATTETPAPPKYEAPKYEEPKYEAPKYEKPKVEVKVEAPKKSAPAPSGQLGVSGNQWGITYTPYTDDTAGNCKNNETIKADIAVIAQKGFTAIRVYSTDCYALELIPAACESNGVKMIVGVFIDESGIGGAQEQIDAIVAWKQWQLVDLVVIGNEALHASPPRCSPSELAGFISSCKSALQGAGYKGPVTTAEPLNVWEDNAHVLCGAVDVVGLNIHPFFNSDIDASKAGKFAKGQLEIAEGLCPGKDAYNLETGWPSKADRCNGVACAGPAEQAIAIKGIQEEIGGKSIMFSYKDDGWKEPGEFGCEQHWGCIQLFGN